MRRSKPVPTIEEMKAELELVLTHLQPSTNVGRFLAYVCEEYFNGRADRLKEYTIALEAFGRPESFQSKEDPVVRVYARRLRQYLAEYYRGEGSEHQVQIRLPKGGYTPEFRLVATEPEAEAAQVAEVEAASARELEGKTEATQLGKPDADLGQQVPVTRPFWRTLPYVVVGSAVVLCLLAALGWRMYSHQRSQLSLFEMEAAAAHGSVSSQGDELRILAGNSVPTYIDKLGRVWLSDRYFSGGDAAKALYEPVSRAYDPNLWLYRRSGQSFRYDVPLKAGTYELHLLFVEDTFGIDQDRAGGEGTRVFDVEANGKKLLTEFDIIRDAGAARTGDERVFLVSPSSDGFLHLEFSARVEQAILSAIEIIPAPGNRMRPIRIATRNIRYISRGQVSWRPDQYYFGGHQHEIRNPVTNTENPELFSTERFGNFSYAIPVAEGKYTAVLYFSEAFFGTANTKDTVGGRVFDVYFNGTAILKEFDIYKEAGGANRVVRKEFHGLHPDTLGKLVFTFHPNRSNSPSINAIEIIPEG